MKKIFKDPFIEDGDVEKKTMPPPNDIGVNQTVPSNMLPLADGGTGMSSYISLIKGYKRYEKVRKLNPRQFSELWKRNLNGEGPFDELVDKL